MADNRIGTEDKTPKWRDRYPVLVLEDNDLLDTNSSVKEFRGGLSKEQAEAEAHKDYLKNHAIDSAAYHLLGMHAATAANHESAAKKHGQAYSLAVKHLGLNPTNTPSKEILDRAKNIEKNPYSFKAHQADGFFVPKVEIPGTETPPENKTLQLLERLKSLRAKTSNNT
jgi:hypothetical protein